MPRFADVWLRQLSLSSEHQGLAALALRMDADARKIPTSDPGDYYDDDDDDDYDDDDYADFIEGEDYDAGGRSGDGEDEL